MSKGLKIIFLCIVALWACTQSATAQGERNHWMFGNNHWIEFVSDTPVYRGYVPLSAGENCASISDKNGNLLFYGSTTGWWNRDHQPLLGTSLIESGNNSWTQGVLILPLPGDTLERFFYMLHHTDETGFLNQRLSYSVVDMTLDSGKGGVVATERDITLVEDFFMEQLHAVRHANGKDWWVFTRNGVSSPLFDGAVEDDTFSVFGLTPSGFTTPTCQPIGLPQGHIGELTSSPEGEKLALVIQDTDSTYESVQIFDFDRCTGMISNPQTLMSSGDSLEGEPIGKNFYGASFSENASKLYVSTADWKEALYQIDLNESPPIVNVIFKKSISNHLGGQIERGPDGKIYQTFNMLSPVPPDSNLIGHWLSVVHKPNLSGALCEFDTFGFFLGGNQMLEYGLPNHVNYTLGALPGGCDSATTGVDAIVPAENWVHPTVGSGLFYLQYVQESRFSVSVWDINGNQLNIKESKENPWLDLSPFPDGLYFVHLLNLDTGQSKIQKIIKSSS